MSLAREVAHPPTTGVALYFAALIHYQRGDLRLAVEAASAAAALGTGQGAPVWAERAALFSACLTVEPGRGEEAIAQICRDLTPARIALWGWQHVLLLCRLADACRQRQPPEQGLRLLAEAAALAEQGGVGFYVPELHRLRGELLLAQSPGAAAEAEAGFRRALEVARNRQARSFELRATTSLGRLLQRQGRREEARRALAGIYGWFREGFATRDLTEAKALLDTL